MELSVPTSPNKMLFGVALILVIACGCHSINQYFNQPNDGPLEELTEAMLDAIIESHTGIKVDIDLTPGS